MTLTTLYAFIVPMRIATAFGLLLAVLMGFLAVGQLSDVAVAVEAVTTGPLSQFIVFMPYLAVGLVLFTAVAFVLAAAGRRR